MLGDGGGWCDFLNVGYRGVVVVDIAGLFGELRVADGNLEVGERGEVFVDDFGFDAALGGFFKCFVVFGNRAFIVRLPIKVFGGIEELLHFLRAAHHEGR